MDTKIYKIVTIEEMLKLNIDLKRKCRISINKDKALIKYDNDVEGGMNNEQIVNYLQDNYNEWNEPDLL